MIRIIKKKYRGVSVLILTVALLLISMLLILFAGQYSALQQKISSNFYRNQQAYQAAQAGLEAAIPYFQTNYAAIVAGASSGFLTPYMNSSTQNVSLANSSKYTFVYTNPTANNYQLITITSTGVNADATSTRILKQQIQAYGSSMSTPTVTTTTQGAVNLANTAALTNSQTNSNIKAGGSISFSGSSHTSTSVGITSNSSILGSDVSQNVTALSSQSAASFLQSIFGVNQATLKSEATQTYSYFSNHTYNSNLNGTTGAIIWVDQNSGTATINSTTVVGSVAKPVILVINGNLQIGGSATIYGLVFILNPSTGVIVQRNAIINGAIASTGSITFQAASALNYNSSVLNALPSVGTTTTYAKVPGSWKDF